MASIIQKGFEDLQGMISLIESAIIEANNDPATNKPRIRSERERNLAKLERKLAAMVSERSKEKSRICVTNRESSHSGFVCNKGADCHFIHKTTGNVCTKPEYLEFGRCLDFFTTCEVLARIFILFQIQPRQNMARHNLDGRHCVRSIQSQKQKARRERLFLYSEG